MPAQTRKSSAKPVTADLEDLVRESRHSDLEKAMAEMANDPCILSECAAIQAEFARTEPDGGH